MSSMGVSVSWKYRGENLNSILISSISQLLANEGISSVLWGDALLTVMGVPSIVQHIDFIIDDSSMTKAQPLLLNAGLKHCSYETCSVRSKIVTNPRPATHLHFNRDSYLGLHRHSEAMWQVASLDESAITAIDQADIILASNQSLPEARPDRGSGRFPASLPPVKIPSPHRLVETYVLLYARTRRKDDPKMVFWTSMLTYMVSYVKEEGLINESKLTPPCRDFFNWFSDTKSMTKREAAKRLLQAVPPEEA